MKEIADTCLVYFLVCCYPILHTELFFSPYRAIEIKVALQSVVKVLYKQLNLLTPEELTKICKQGQPDVSVVTIFV